MLDTCGRELAVVDAEDDTEPLTSAGLVMPVDVEQPAANSTATQANPNRTISNPPSPFHPCRD